LRETGQREAVEQYAIERIHTSLAAVVWGSGESLFIWCDTESTAVEFDLVRLPPVRSDSSIAAHLKATIRV
jgi:hypothetical protein